MTKISTFATATPGIRTVDATALRADTLYVINTFNGRHFSPRIEGLSMDAQGLYSSEVGDHQVVFHPGIGWICDCVHFKDSHGCEHVIKAAALLTWERTQAAE